MKEATERRAAWCKRQRSSGVAARNRAHSTLSSPVIPFTRGSLRNTAAIFFAQPKLFSPEVVSRLILTRKSALFKRLFCGMT